MRVSTIRIAALLVPCCLAGSAVYAQPLPPPRPTPVRVPATPEQRAAQQMRSQISIMEVALQRAVGDGIRAAIRRIPEIVAGPWGWPGNTRARGFRVEGYGLFFDVEVPELPASFIWSMQTLNRDPVVEKELKSLRAIVATVPDAATRQQLQMSLTKIESNIPAGATAATPVSNTSPVPADNPDEIYTGEVQNALIEAILDQGSTVALGPDDRLTIAARGTQNATQMAVGEPYEQVTMFLSIRGRDLDALRMRQITREEARKRIETREF